MLATEIGSMHVSKERLSRFLRFLTVVHLWFQLNLYITPACRQPTSVGYPSYIVPLDIKLACTLMCMKDLSAVKIPLQD